MGDPMDPIAGGGLPPMTGMPDPMAPMSPMAPMPSAIPQGSDINNLKQRYADAARRLAMMQGPFSAPAGMVEAQIQAMNMAADTDQINPEVLELQVRMMEAQIQSGGTGLFTMPPGNFSFGPVAYAFPGGYGVMSMSGSGNGSSSQFQSMSIGGSGGFGWSFGPPGWPFGGSTIIIRR